ncbi:MAG TPA: hypothetical protein VE548_00040 [Nitrososphaeraceae archaeon]|nr:hypothetical protein [Nitrososphaeraceae archaeon]
MKENRNKIGNFGPCYMCGKVKRIAIQHDREDTEDSQGSSRLRLVCEDCAGLTD